MSDATFPIKVAVLATNSEGAPEFHTCSIEVTQAAYDAGEHYTLAKENAEFNGFEEPMIAFDERDQAARDLPNLAVWI